MIFLSLWPVVGVVYNNNNGNRIIHSDLQKLCREEEEYNKSIFSCVLFISIIAPSRPVILQKWLVISYETNHLSPITTIKAFFRTPIMNGIKNLEALLQYSKFNFPIIPHMSVGRSFGRLVGR